MENLKTKSIGEFVAADYRTAAVFTKYGIDFCCRGGKTIQEVCENADIAPDELLAQLDEATQKSGGQNVDYKSWDLDLLVDYIEKKHHRYVEQAIPVIKEYLAKLCDVHGSHHPELFEINKEFIASAGALTMHMKKEELVLFPFVRKMVSYTNNGKAFAQAGHGSVESPINMMMEEHDIEGERFRKIAKLSNNYTTPPDGCNTYMVGLSRLKEFEDDLHLHIHLENNILFPRALKLEKELSA